MHKFNNSKKSLTNEEFLTDDEYLSKEDLHISEEAKTDGIEKGKTSQRIIDKQALDKSVKNVVTTGHESGISAAKSSGQMAISMSSIMNIVAVMKREKTLDEAITDTVIDARKSAITSYAVTGALTVVSRTLAASDSAFVQSLVKANVPAKIVTTIMITGKTIMRYTEGEINT